MANKYPLPNGTTLTTDNFNDAPKTLELMMQAVDNGISSTTDYEQNASLLTTYINAADFFEDTGTIINAYNLIADSGRYEIYKNTNGGLIRFRPLSANTGASTISVSGQTPVNLLTEGGTPLTGSELSPNKDAYVRFNGTAYLLLNSALNQITVQDFGAVGNGVTDDTTAINNALAFSKNVDFGVNKTYVYSGIPPFNGHTIYGNDITFKITEGQYTATTPFWVGATVGGNIKFISQTERTTSITNQVSVSGSAGNYSVVLQLSNIQSASVGDAIITTNVVGTGRPEIHRSQWKITNVNTGSSQITVKNTCRFATFPVNTITSSTSYIVKTVFNFNDCDALVLTNSCIAYWHNIAVFGNSDTYWNSGNISGTEKGTHGCIVGGQTVAVNGKLDNINRYGVGRSFISFGTIAGFSGFDQQGFVVENGQSWGDFLCCSNNKRRGIYISTGSSGRHKHYSCNGNYLDGSIVDINGSLYASSVSCAIGNGGSGVSGTQNGCNIFDSGISAYNNGYGLNSNEQGYIQSTNCILDYNLLGNAYAEDFSRIYMDNSQSSNSIIGAYSAQSSNIEAQGATFTSNTTDIRIDDDSSANLIGATYTTLTTRNNSNFFDSAAYYRGSEYQMNQLIFTPATSTNEVRLTPTNAADALTFDFNGSGGYQMLANSNGFRPVDDNTKLLGNATRRWNTIYAGTGTINTSDENAKQDIRGFTPAEITVAQTLKTMGCMFKFKDAVATKGDNARLHAGFIAQQVAQVFLDNGLTPESYGLFCKDLKEDKKTYIYGLRYEELLCFIICAS